MKSTITELYDYTKAMIPKDLLRWRIPDEEIARQLEALSRSHAYEEEADEVQAGDSIACRGESEAARWNRPVLLFYPGRGLCAPELEDGCVGARVGERRTVQTEEGEVALTVERIVRRRNMPVGDELVQAENLPGVETVDDYYRWYRDANEPGHRKEAASRAAGFLLKEIQAHSVLSIDQTEKDKWLWGVVNTLYDSMVQAGVDPTIPEDGFEFLTEEEAKAKMYKERENLFSWYAVHAYMAEKLSGLSLDEICREGVKKFAAEQGYTAEYIWENSARTTIYWKFVTDRAVELLGEYAEQFLEA